MSSIPSAADRIAAQNRQMQGQKVICSQCGGNQFYEVQATTYRAGGSGSVEIQAESDGQMFPILICMCGFPVLPKPATGRRHGGIYESAHKVFRESVTISQEYLRAETAKEIANEVLKVAAGKEVESKMETLDARVSKLETDLGEPNAPKSK